jgi:hypothetical protein
VSRNRVICDPRPLLMIDDPSQSSTRTMPPQPCNLNTEAPLHGAFSQCMMMEADAGNDVEAQMLAHCLGYLIT